MDRGKWSRKPRVEYKGAEGMVSTEGVGDEA
jgi:hypothetical protein